MSGEARRLARGRNSAAADEDQIAVAFTLEHGGTLKFCHSAGRWHEWTGSHWAPDDRRRAFHFARETMRAMGGAGSAGTAAGVERFARADPAHAAVAADWDRDPMLLATPGGTVDLRTGRLRPADPTDMCTKLAGAAPEPGDPARWLQFLSETFAADAAMIAFLQRVAGYFLTGDTREHALFFGYGPGGNGKSVFAEVLAALLGDYATTAPMETFAATRGSSHPTDLAMLRGARLVTASETEEGRAWAEARIKQLTGGDKISARFMRQDFFTYEPQFKLFIIGNHAPALHSVDDAMRRRFNILPFVNRPESPDPELKQRLLAELPQIMAWAIEGCLLWQRAGLGQPETVRAATADYFSEQDVLAHFIEDRCEVGPRLFELTGRLFRAWADYAQGSGEQPGSAKSFGSKLRKRGFEPAKLPGGVSGRRDRIWRGLALRIPEQDGRYGD